MILASGQVVNLPGTPEEPGAVAKINVQLAPRSDVLLDIGTQIEIVSDIAAAVRHTSRLDLTQFKSASQCRPVPATPSTDPTIIPGTDLTPATPPIVIQGGPGMPDTVIPGTRATPGTPPTVIGGSSGSPGLPYPPPPAVTSEPVLHTESLALCQPLRVAGTLLLAGTYRVAARSRPASRAPATRSELRRPSRSQLARVWRSPPAPTSTERWPA